MPNIYPIRRRYCEPGQIIDDEEAERMMASDAASAAWHAWACAEGDRLAAEAASARMAGVYASLPAPLGMTNLNTPSIGLGKVSEDDLDALAKYREPVGPAPMWLSIIMAAAAIACFVAALLLEIPQ